ncbi:MAG: hypothetical protein A3B99_01595 [Candidatus Yanofskybacteria bacterium RIFCSPHIGHO2_02_FULL_44_12b]|uniref:CBS domain-containing protein n=2 Tax=Candidatus Yanofskyibacteriota TaxID=1752733 RepID=A0A1F8GJJ5_9BACT|nr:MAG: IMP dehydrogenase [Candidatus Yanofskybacteria bacterium GW2011_GWA2_44_9]OGN04879.1 MAG: hypothetical protein A2659_04735 [Candidatus Yanofskybacteria bacterium RIFCSPHIGHO2_01_FULL_44_24]OGN16227.1 MAG: hypothetical protein A3B99_01595 [Candidatus Yanofskybacteria bacterium RIFCSPHIGHO2_02_FULL_44_12b]OGN25575.1 MAG: hypothetical protein A2925_05140 [Candidatus Yanofskybacteria bacterium RIFCSPLOWO2_01_FULL_44_22]
MENKQEQEAIARVSDIMRVGVISVKPEDSLEYAAELFEKYNYDGFPVIDHSRKLVGIVTGYDMILQGSGMHLPTILNIMKQASQSKVDNKTLDDHFKKLREIKIREVMNVDPLVVGPDVKVEDLAKEFAQHHRVNPIPVVDDQKRLLGIVSRYDLIKFFNEQYFRKIIGDTDHSGILQRLERVGVDGVVNKEGTNQDRASLDLWFRATIIAGIIGIVFWILFSFLNRY